MPHGRLTGLDNISRGEERVTEDTIRVSSEMKDSWGRRYRLSGVKSNSVQGFKFKMPMGFLLVESAKLLFIAISLKTEYIAHKCYISSTFKEPGSIRFRTAG